MPKLDLNSHVFVTGATGLIGGEVVRHLLARTEARVSCLVRGRTPEEARARLITRLERSGESLDPKTLSRVEAITGDLLEPELGIGPKEKARLSASVDVMIHSAADTSFLTQRRCRDTNIVGTENALALGKRFAKSPLFAHVSTACNVGEMRHRCLPEDEGCQASNQHHNEYTRSKAIAEERVIDSGLDYLVVRPSIVLSAGLPDPVFARQILWIAPLFQEFERLPINPQARIDVVPVSYVAESLIALVQLDRRQHTCYHLSAGLDHSITMADWIDAINRNYSTREPLKLPTDGAWTKADEARYVTTPRQRKLYFAMRHYLPFLNMDLVFDNTRLREEVDVMRKGLAHPKTYLGELLDLIPFETAMEESANP